MSQERALLEAIAAAPDDDAPRLIFADWLDDQGQGERAEFIRVQCALARMDADDERFDEFKARQFQLQQTSLPALVGDPELVGTSFRRGFVDAIVLCADDLIKGDDAFFRWAPAPKIHLVAAKGLLAEVARAPALGRAMGLTLGCEFFDDDDGLAALLASPYLTRLRKLAFLSTNVGTAAARLVAVWPAAARLRRLSFVNCDLETAGLECLAESPHLGALKRLDFDRNNLGNGGLEALARGRFPRLTALDLTSCHLAAAGLRALAHSAGFPRLVDLQLSCNTIDSAAAAALAGSPLLSRLESLDLSLARLGPAEVRTLLAGGAPALTQLDLGDNRIGDDGIRALAEHFPPRLKQLSLYENDIRAAGAAALAGTPGLARVTCLDLSDNRLGPDGVQALVASPLVANLRTLRLRNVVARPGGAAAIAASPHLTRLRTLELADNSIGSHGVAVLKRATNLPSLRTLDVSGNGDQKEKRSDTTGADR